MNDKDIRDKYLAAEIETVADSGSATAGWSSVSASLKRRARVRRIAYTASSILSVAAIAALLYIGPSPESPETSGTPLLASIESQADLNDARGKAEVIVPSATGENFGSGESPATGGQLYGVKVVNSYSGNRSTAVTEASGSNPASGETKPEVSIRSKGSESTTTGSQFAGDKTAILDDYYAEATLQEKISKRQKISAYLAVNGIAGTKGGITGGRASATTFKASPLGASLMQSSGLESNTIDTGRYEDAQFKHSAPIGAELVLNIPLWHRSGGAGVNQGCLSIESGVSYSYLRSQLLFQGHVKTDEQRVQYVGIPLRIRYSFGSNSAFSTYISAGGKLEWAADARVAGNKVSEKGVQVSLGANAGVQWKASDHIYMYAQPEISYYLTESRLKTIRTDNPLSVGLSIGLGFSL